MVTPVLNLDASMPNHWYGHYTVESSLLKIVTQLGFLTVDQDDREFVSIRLNYNIITTLLLCLFLMQRIYFN